jgi:hypothetical protein
MGEVQKPSNPGQCLRWYTISSVGITELTFADKYRHTSGMLLLCCFFCRVDLRVCFRDIEVNRGVKLSSKGLDMSGLKEGYLREPQVEIQTGESSTDILLVTNIMSRFG